MSKCYVSILPPPLFPNPFLKFAGVFVSPFILPFLVSLSTLIFKTRYWLRFKFSAMYLKWKQYSRIWHPYYKSNLQVAAQLRAITRKHPIQINEKLWVMVDSLKLGLVPSNRVSWIMRLRETALYQTVVIFTVAPNNLYSFPDYFQFYSLIYNCIYCFRLRLDTYCWELCWLYCRLMICYSKSVTMSLTMKYIFQDL